MKQRSLLLHSPLFACLVFVAIVCAQQPTTRSVLGADSDLVKLVEARFANFPKHDMFAFDRLSSVFAIPERESPANTLEELQGGKTVGAVFVPTGSTRLKLPPGVYSVFILKKDGEWKAQFRNGKEEAVITAPAKVSSGPPVELPVAFVDRSICYEFDSTII